MNSELKSLSMKGDGYYDSHSQVQNVVIRQLIPLVTELIASIPSPAPEHEFCIVDYGCSEGKNSIIVIKAAIEAVRKLLPNQLFMVVHEDLPANNFNRLFDQIYNGDGKPGASIYGSSLESPVLVFASGSSFYARVMPSEAVQLGISSSAAHWTSSSPKIDAHIFHAGASIEENENYADAAALDWFNFLKSRSLELVPGGKIVVTVAARVSAKDAGSIYKLHENHSAKTIFQLLNDLLEELVKEKQLESSALANFSIPIYCRNKDELVEPVTTGELQGQLLLEAIKIESIPCPLHTQFKKDGDAGTYAAGLTGIVRAITEPLMLSGLFNLKERRKSALASVPEQKILELIFARMQAKIMASPDLYTFYPCHATMVFAKSTD